MLGEIISVFERDVQQGSSEGTLHPLQNTFQGPVTQFARKKDIETFDILGPMCLNDDVLTFVQKLYECETGNERTNLLGMLNNRFLRAGTYNLTELERKGNGNQAHF